MGEKSVTSNPYPPTEVRNQANPVTRSPNETTITHSVSQTIISGNSVACSASGIHADNHYLRVFDLPAFGIDNDFMVTSVDIGIEEALAGSGGTQPAELRLYTLEGPFIWANLTLIASAPVNVTDQSLTIINMPVEGTIPAGSLLVVDFFTPDGDAASHSMFVGSNNLGQTAPTYIAAADCGITEPTDTTLIGYPGMHLVMNVYGEVDSQGLPWLSEIPTNGTVNADSVFEVTLSFDSMTYTVGSYTGILVINTLDPVNDRIGIPVTMHVFTPQAPVVSYTSNSPVMIGDPVLFTNTSNPGVPVATEFEWDYGDGVTETLGLEDPVSHLYTTYGTFSVTLKACNVVDCDIFSADVTVLPPPINRFFLPLVNR